MCVRHVHRRHVRRSATSILVAVLVLENVLLAWAMGSGYISVIITTHPFEEHPAYRLFEPPERLP
jgi:hypothetical protein